MWERLKVGKLHMVDYLLWSAWDLPECIEPVYSQAALEPNSLVVLLETATVSRAEEDFLNNYHTRCVKLLDEGGGVGWYAFRSTVICPLHPVEGV